MLARAHAGGTLWPGFNAPGFSRNLMQSDAVQLLMYDGTLVALGTFESIGQTTAFGAAAWDGTQWTALGAGIFGENFSGRILGGAVVGHDLVVARTPLVSFNDSDVYPFENPTPIDFVRWDDHTWQPITRTSPVLPGTIQAFAGYHGELVVAGTFDSLDGAPATNIAAWDGSGWHALGSGLDVALRGSSTQDCGYYGGVVSSLLVLGDRLYAAGHFDGSGDRAMRNVAAWDGQAWQPLHRGLERWVTKLCEYQGDLVAYGAFRSVEGVLSPGLARFDGMRWSSIGGAAPHQWDFSALASDGSRLFATTSEWSPVTHSWYGTLRIWDGAHWTAVTGPAGTSALLPFAGRLYAAGGFDRIDSERMNGVASADLGDLAHWTSPAPGVGFTGRVDYRQGGPWGPNVTALTAFQGDVVLSVADLDLGLGVRATILRRSGDAWIALGDFDAPVHALTVVGDRLMAAGDFKHVGSLAVEGVAAWDGAHWNAVGNGIAEGGVQAVIPYAGGFVATGSFSYIDGQQLYGMAAWNGSQWERVGTSNVIQGATTAAIYQGHLLVGGSFTFDGRKPSRRIAEWDGTEWREFHGGANGRVRSLVVDGDKLYVVGDFTQVNGIAARSAAVWDGSAWQPLSAESGATLAAIAVVGPQLYGVSHVFRRGPNGLEYTSQLVAWNGASWEARAPRSPGYVAGLQAVGGSIYIGGCFHFFGGQPAGSIARWDIAPAIDATRPVVVAQTRAMTGLSVQTSSARHAAVIRFSVDSPGTVDLGIYDVRGRLVEQLASGARAAGSYETTWDQQDSGGHRVGRGVYFVRLVTPSATIVRKAVLMQRE